MRNTWSQLETLPGGVDGARKQFETACFRIITAMNPGKRVWQVREYPGDHGIDIGVGSIDEPIDIYQVKYFPREVGDSQQKQIRESYRTAANDPDHVLANWFLCLPISLATSERRWFDKWRKGVGKKPIEFIEPDLLLKAAGEHNLLDGIFNNELEQNVREILTLTANGADEFSVRRNAAEADLGRMVVELARLVCEGWSDMTPRIAENAALAKAGDVAGACALLQSVLVRSDVAQKRRNALFAARGTGGVLLSYHIAKRYEAMAVAAADAGRADELSGHMIGGLVSILSLSTYRPEQRQGGWFPGG